MVKTTWSPSHTMGRSETAGENTGIGSKHRHRPYLLYVNDCKLQMALNNLRKTKESVVEHNYRVIFINWSGGLKKCITFLYFNYAYSIIMCID